MTDQTNTVADKKGAGKVGAALVSAWGASYLMNQASLHGVNFEVLGVSSEIIKATLVAHLVTFCVWVTPAKLVQCLKDCIISARIYFSQLRDAWSKPLDKGE